MPGRALTPAAVLTARLDDSGPLAVAFSGGADSLLALRETLDWATPRGRPVIALIVDHGLQDQSAAWAAFAAETAEALGASARVLGWEGDKPRTGIAAAARAARHRLLADAARAAGARVIVTGHTGTDAAETAALGQGRLSDWAPSPAWPQGRGIFLLRPLLGLSRQAVRERLEGARWIEDPANEDERHPRVRARRALGELALTPSGERGVSPLAAAAEFSAGVLKLERSCLMAAGQSDRRTALAAAAVCAGGGERLPGREAVERLCGRLAEGQEFVATLAGSVIVAQRDEISVSRNAGDIGRTSATLLNGGVWDGRYDLAGPLSETPVPLHGQARRLPQEQRRALTSWPARARPGLPVILSQDGPPTCPILAGGEGAFWRWLVPARFSAACGLIAREGQL